MPVARLVLRVSPIERFFREAAGVVRSKRYATTVENLCSIGCAGLFVSVVAGSVVGASPVFGLALAACAGIACRFALERTKEARVQRLREGVPDVLRAMESCFFAGLSLLQTFQHIAAEVEGPLGELFARGARELETGRTADEALAAFKSQAGVPELAFVAIALQVQHDAGGSMHGILSSARESVESDLELRRSLQVQTAQAKLSARVVTAMPFVLMAVFSLITENFLAPFFTSPIGLALLVIAVTMQVAGVLIVRSLLRVGFD
ncbi:type II secretion system F family protein [Raoultibacter phocaeensis]|uniref:type II secretion system F family protein n=1 Tax=Raoultibacter phocaeensis TaxID=2479841 RepID=UPI00111B61AE